MTHGIRLALTLASALALGACNTAEGMGKDLESAGAAIEEEAQEHSE